MQYTGVDLAAKSSAVCVLDSSGQVAREFASTQMSELLFVRKIVHCASVGTVLIEDTPPGLRYDINTKNVCRLQGRILQEVDHQIDRHMMLSGTVNNIVWVQPMKWMRYFGWQSKAKSGSTASWAKATCTEAGYEPPEWAHGSKLLQDCRDAYLIARYAYETFSQ